MAVHRKICLYLLVISCAFSFPVHFEANDRVKKNLGDDIKASGNAKPFQGDDMVTRNEKIPGYLKDLVIQKSMDDVKQFGCSLDRTNECRHGDVTIYKPTVTGNRISGLLLIWYNGKWGTVCDDVTDCDDPNGGGHLNCANANVNVAGGKNLAQVACRALGYSGGEEYNVDGTFSKKPIVVDGTLNHITGCAGTETHLSECRWLKFGSHNCNHEEDVGVNCQIAYEETGEITFDGAWGQWGPKKTCVFPHFVHKMQLKIEPRIDGDDTALNAIKLTCSDGNTITSDQGPWGTWRDVQTCHSKRFIDQVQFRQEERQGNGDDTAANGVRFRCNDGSGYDYTPGDGYWGTWSAWGICPPGSAVFGIQTKVEHQQGDGDDSALNGVRFFCSLV